jgi:hypothetical protein
MLGWWTDETKGYRLEDLESGKLITSIDVDFSEDDMPSELATFDLGLTQSNEEEVNEMIDSAMEYDDEHYRLPTTPPQTSSTSPIEMLPTTPIRESTPQVPSSTSSEITAREGESVSDIGPIINVPPAPRKSKKWSDLPKREVSTHQQKQTKRYGENDETHMAFIAVGPSLDEALNSSNTQGWQKAINTEYKQLVNRGVIEDIKDLPEGKKAVGSKVVLKEKLDEFGNHAKFKARIVTQGFSQIPGIDFTETFSSVAKFTSLRIFLTLAAIHNWDIHQIDVVGAYLEGNLDEEIFMKVPKGVMSDGKYWKLKKVLYGLKQAGRKWKERLDEVLVKLGFEKTRSDDCLYILHEKGDIVLIILVYVDDMAVTGPRFDRIITFKHNLGNQFEITDLGELKYILGI